MEEIKWENLYRVINEYIVEVRNKYQDNLITNGHIATGDLLNSVDCIVEVNGTVLTASLKLADYYKYVEWDTKPHFPPIDKIRDWVHVKGLPTEESTGNKSLPTENQLAYLIGRKISKVGTKGTNDLTNSIQEINQYYLDRIKEAITMDVTSNLVLIDITFK